MKTIEYLSMKKEIQCLARQLTDIALMPKK